MDMFAHACCVCSMSGDPSEPSLPHPPMVVVLAGVSTLLALGAPVDDKKSGKAPVLTPLCAAAENGSLEILKALLVSWGRFLHGKPVPRLQH